MFLLVKATESRNVFRLYKIERQKNYVLVIIFNSDNSLYLKLIKKRPILVAFYLRKLIIQGKYINNQMV